jgi:hypothetical protein
MANAIHFEGIEVDLASHAEVPLRPAPLARMAPRLFLDEVSEAALLKLSGAT